VSLPLLLLQSQADESLKLADQILIIPPKYRYPLALATMIELIQTGRADSWEKCADKYEEQYHRWVVEHNCQQSMILQQQTLTAANSAKSYASAAAVFRDIVCERLKLAVYEQQALVLGQRNGFNRAVDFEEHNT
jgi:hypothetical protein